MNSPASRTSRCHSTNCLQPRDPLIVFGGSATSFFVLPVRGDSFFGHAMHFFGADLNLEVPPSRTHHRGMQCLIQVRTRNRNEIFDAARNGMPLIVDHAQGGIAVLHRVGDDADGQQIVHLIECESSGVSASGRPSRRA